MSRRTDDDLYDLHNDDLPPAPPDTLGDNGLRVLFGAIGMWRSCPQKRCRRARRCIGDFAPCKARFVAVPYEVRLPILRAIKEAARLRTARDAANEAAADMDDTPSPPPPRHDRRAPPARRPAAARRPPS